MAKPNYSFENGSESSPRGKRKRKRKTAKARAQEAPGEVGARRRCG